MKREVENKRLSENYFLFTGVRSQTVRGKYIHLCTLNVPVRGRAKERQEGQEEEEEEVRGTKRKFQRAG